MKMTHKLSLLAGAIALSAGSAAQALTIDLFDVDQGPLILGTGAIGAPTQTDYVDGATSSIVGGQRDVYGQLMIDSNSTIDSTFEVAGGTLNISNSTGAASTWQIQWDGVDNNAAYESSAGAAGASSTPPGSPLPPATWPDAENLALGGLNFGLDLDLSGDGGIVLTVLDSDLGFDFQITLFSGTPDPDGDGPEVSTLQWATVSLQAAQVTLGDPPLEELISFDAFKFGCGYRSAELGGAGPYIEGVNYVDCSNVVSGPSLLDFTNITAIVAEIDTSFNSTAGAGDTGGFRLDLDLQIDQAVTVPEPGTIALLGMGLLAAGGVAGKRRRKTQA